MADRLGARPADLVFTSTGATMPQVLFARACERVATGESECALVCGAEAFRSADTADVDQLIRRLSGEQRQPSPALVVGDVRPHATALESAYGLHLPVVAYSLFANAYRCAKGQPLEGYRSSMAHLCAQMARVAKDNPYAWFRDGKTAEEIAAVTPSNPMVHYPYTKYMTAMMNVDQAAAILITSEEKAMQLGVAPWTARLSPGEQRRL